MDITEKIEFEYNVNGAIEVVSAAFDLLKFGHVMTQDQTHTCFVNAKLAMSYITGHVGAKP